MSTLYDDTQYKMYKVCRVCCGLGHSFTPLDDLLIIDHSARWPHGRCVGIRWTSDDAACDKLGLDSFTWFEIKNRFNFLDGYFPFTTSYHGRSGRGRIKTPLFPYAAINFAIPPKVVAHPPSATVPARNVTLKCSDFVSMYDGSADWSEWSGELIRARGGVLKAWCSRSAFFHCSWL